MPRTISPAGAVTTMTYDVRGNRRSHTDTLGRTTLYLYNHLDKLTQAMNAILFKKRTSTLSHP
ncbi:MAG: hypothetical protein ACE5GK_09900 [Nitrospiria bacterium]